MSGVMHTPQPWSVEIDGYGDTHVKAAAPELLAAAKAALRFVQNAEHDSGRDLSEGNVLRAAIDKAEGRK